MANSSSRWRPARSWRRATCSKGRRSARRPSRSRRVSSTWPGSAPSADPPPGHSQYLRFVPKPMSAVELRALAQSAGRPALRRPGSARAGGPGGSSRGRGPGHLAPAPRSRAGRHRRGGVRALRGDPWPRSAHRLSLPGPPGRAVDRPALPVLLRDERLALHLRWRERPRVGLGAMLRHPRGAARRRRGTGVVLCGSTRREGRRPPASLGRPAPREVGGTPVVYPGAGSHATYLERGEYIMALPFPGEQNLHGPLDLLRNVWRDTLAQPDPGDLAGKVRTALSVPFVDYARGDGLVVGPGGEHPGCPSPSTMTTPGWTAIAGSGALIPATASPASGRRPVRSTRGPDPSASRGTTRWGSPACPRSRRRLDGSPTCGPASAN